MACSRSARSGEPAGGVISAEMVSASSQKGDDAQFAARGIIAQVQGKFIHRSDVEQQAEGLSTESYRRLSNLILTPLLAKYRQAHGITATDEEILALVRSVWDKDAADITETDREVATPFIVNWKIAKHLYDHYGGMVVFQQANPFEPVGAYQAFLREQCLAGAFAIYDPQYRERFWEFYDRSYGPWVIPPEKVHYDKPWWIDAPAEE